MTTIHALRDLLTLAHRIAEDGIAAHDPSVVAVAAEARRHGVDPVLVDLLADPVAPAAARERAFGRVATVLAAHHRHDTEPRRSRAPVDDLVAC